RRAFVSGLTAGAGLLLAAPDSSSATNVTLNIAPAQLEVAPGHTITTAAYNGSAPGPLIRMREGVTVSVNIFNRSDVAEYVHWHGFDAPAKLDGTEEERSLVVPAHGHLQYEMTPRQTGSRYVHSHAMAMDDLSRGPYSGQFAFVYVEPRHNPGRYDQEIFLSTHEWEPYFMEGDDDPSAMTEEHDGETDWGPSMAEVGYGIYSINGKALGHGEPVRVKQGQRVLFHILNASATEDIQLYLPGHEFVVVALDGNPVPRPSRVSILELGVGERVDAVVHMTNPGIWILGSTDNDVRGSGLGILIEYAGRQGAARHISPSGATWDYLLFGEERETVKPDEILPMVIERIDPDGHGLEHWAINGRIYSDQDEPKVLTRGSRYRLAFENRTGDAHPLHLHRHTFELVRIGGKPTAGVRKDVVVLQGFQTLEVDFIPRQTGLTLFHCHQQMHMDQGFKTLFRVV
ncbi:MAG TPA: multicopper oxidase domain-containing protein, partial [Bryobacteraceae bacterium]|nr:multicopper oxidase domain-containing protein [Bryobacteraceae bacterium]